MSIYPTSGTTSSYTVNLGGGSGSSSFTVSGFESSSGSISLSGSSANSSVTIAGTADSTNNGVRYWDVDVTFPFELVLSTNLSLANSPYLGFWYGSTTCTVNSGSVTSFDIINNTTLASCIINNIKRSN